MPEYLAPGVYVEEVSFRSKSIEGVPTSTTGFAGMTRYGPVLYSDPRTDAANPTLPGKSEPRLITSFTEFEAVYGGLEPLAAPADTDQRIPYTAHAARAFFDNGGKRLYISRVFTPRADDNPGIATLDIAVGGGFAAWKARWPGAYGNVLVTTKLTRSGNVAVQPRDAQGNPVGGVEVRGVRLGSVMEVIPNGVNLPTSQLPKENLDAGHASAPQYGVYELVGGNPQITAEGGGAVALDASSLVRLVQMQVIVTISPSEPAPVSEELAAHPGQKRYVGRILQLDDPEDENAVVWLDDSRLDFTDSATPVRLMRALYGGKQLQGGNDGLVLSPADLAGQEADPDNPRRPATGLEALGEVEDIAIVAAPDAGGLDDQVLREVAAGALIAHAEKLRYRIAVVDGPAGSSLNEIRAFRGKFDSTRAALYHPWIEVLDPTERAAQGAPPRRMMLPPSGFVCGIYARSDVERGVHKAPANEIVRGLTRFESNINHPRQEVLNPEGINALRFFEGRGNRVWGARTMSSDPEWKYVNVRRLFIFMERSIDVGTQWAVFEPNDRRLWANIRQTVEDFLLVLWRDGALMGKTPEEAYFVRCDRTTMTQNDIDNGRMICLIGVAPVKPAEFVIFRIGQWTGDARQ